MLVSIKLYKLTKDKSLVEERIPFGMTELKAESILWENQQATCFALYNNTTQTIDNKDIIKITY